MQCRQRVLCFPGFAIVCRPSLSSADLCGSAWDQSASLLFQDNRAVGVGQAPPHGNGDIHDVLDTLDRDYSKESPQRSVRHNIGEHHDQNTKEKKLALRRARNTRSMFMQSARNKEQAHKNILSDSPYGSVESSMKLSKEYPRPACPSISSVILALHPFTSSTSGVPSAGTRLVVLWR